MDPQLQEYRRKKAEAARAQQEPGPPTRQDEFLAALSANPKNRALPLIVLFLFLNFWHLWPLLLFFGGLVFALWKVGDLSEETRAAKAKFKETCVQIVAGDAGCAKVLFWREEQGDGRGRRQQGLEAGYVPVHLLLLFAFIAAMAVGAGNVLGVVMLWALARFVWVNHAQLQSMMENSEERTMQNVMGLFGVGQAQGEPRRGRL